MRVLSTVLTFAIAACSSSNSGLVRDPAPGTIGQVNTVHCSASVADYCAMSTCNQTLEEAENDARQCRDGYRAGLSVCGEYHVVVSAGVDTVFHAYYKDGVLVAMVGGVLQTCSAGPSTFDAPVCSDNIEPLPVCSN